MSLTGIGERLANAVAPVTPQEHQKPRFGQGGDGHGWVMAAGRGAGKTFATMHWLNGQCTDADLNQHAPLRCRIIAPTLADAVASCVEGPNGLLTMARGRAKFSPSAVGGARVEYDNGAMVWVMGTPTPRDVDRLRALTNINIDVFEEAAANPQIAAAVDQADLSRRRDYTRWAASTTPRNLPIMRQWRDELGQAYVRVPSSANRHLPPGWLEKLEKLKGTRLYRQEVLGEILDDVEGALWTQADLDRSRVLRDLIEELDLKIAIGVDPPSGAGTCGIVVVGRDRVTGKLYVLDDFSQTDVSPATWAMAACAAQEMYGGVIVVEVNQGGRMVTETFKRVSPSTPVTTVHASKGKLTRAEPIAVLWEAEMQAAHMAGESLESLQLLEDQMTSWVPGQFSPDRVDALVWASTHLMKGSASRPRTSKQTIRRPLPGW